MPDEKEAREARGIARFYFSPGLRSIPTLIYLSVYLYFAFYYLDNFLLAFRYIFYTISGHDALQNTSHLFLGMAFVLALIVPFLMSIYAILALHRVWSRTNWAVTAKWIVTGAIVVTSLFAIVVSDKAARLVSRRPSMQSFIEDVNLSGKI